MTTCNLGVKPLGRTEVISPVILAEIAAFKAYKADLATVGTVDNEDASRRLRSVKLKHWAGDKRELIKIYNFLNLGFDIL